MLDSVAKIATSVGLRINAAKTKVMMYSCCQSATLDLLGQDLETVERFSYLGS